MLDMHSPNITNHVINQGWICLCGRKHGAPHVENLFTFKRQILWCPHCKRSYPEQDTFTIIDVLKSYNILQLFKKFPNFCAWFWRELTNAKEHL